MRKVKFVNGSFYHVYNRGVEKRNIFPDAKDYGRFLKSLKCFNQIGRSAYGSIEKIRRSRMVVTKPYVRIHAFCLMKNHFHLLLEQVAEQGISEFMKRVGIGFTSYFNKSNNRTGRLFESKFKCRQILNNSDLINISRYIHLNPLDFHQVGWKTEGIYNPAKAAEFLEKYPWSSYRAYLRSEQINFLTTELLSEIIKPYSYENLIQTSLNFLSKPYIVQDPVLETGSWKSD